MGINLGEFPWINLYHQMNPSHSGFNNGFELGVDGWPIDGREHRIVIGHDASILIGIPAGSIIKVSYKGTLNQFFESDGNTTIVPGRSIQDYPSVGYAYHEVRVTNAIVPREETGIHGIYAFNFRGHVEDVKFMRPGFEIDEPRVIHPQFSDLLKAYSTLRFMAFTNTNSQYASSEYDCNAPSILNWSDRTNPNAPQSFTKGKGGAWEYVVQIANELNKDIFINIPVNASDDYVRGLSRLLLNNLKPGLNVNFEMGNELWNSAGGFCGFRDVYRKCGDDWACHQRWPANRMKEVIDIIAADWGWHEINNRIRGVLCGQIAYAADGHGWNIKEGLNHLENTYGQGTVKKYLYAVGAAPYFGPANHDFSSVESIISQSAININDEIFGEFSDEYHRDSDQYMGNKLEGWFGEAGQYGLKMYAYEGGPDMDYTTGSGGVKNIAMQDPRMRELCLTYWRKWYARYGSDALFCFFLANFNESGLYTLSENISITSTRQDAMNEIMSNPSPDFDISVRNIIPGIVDARKVSAYWSRWNQSPALQYLRPGGSNKWTIAAEKNGTYQLAIEHRTVQNSLIDIYVDGERVHTDLVLPHTTTAPNDWAFASWRYTDAQNVTIDLDISYGVHVIKIVYKGQTEDNFRNLKFTLVGETPPFQPQPIIGGLEVCQGSPKINYATTLDRSVCSYRWTLDPTAIAQGATILPFIQGGPGRSASGQGSNNININWGNVQPGTYTLSLVGENLAGNSPVRTAQITIKKCGFTIASNATCVNADVVITPEDIPNVTSWSWVFDKGGNSATPNIFSGRTPPPIQYNSSGIKYVELKVVIEGETRTFTNTVNVIQPNFSVVKNNPSTCQGKGSIRLTNLSPSVTYQVNYSKDGVSIPQFNILSDINGTIILDDLSIGNYSNIRVAFGTCLKLDPQVYAITVPDAPNFSTSKVDILNCGGTGLITISGLANATEYMISYSRNGTPSAPIALLSSTSGQISITTTSGVYTQVSASRNGCSKVDAQTFTFTEPTLAPFTVVSTPISGCGGFGSLTISNVLPSTSYDVSYTKDGIATTPIPLTSSTTGTIVINNLSAGVYSMVTVVQNNCSRIHEGRFEFVNPSAPTFSVTSTDITTCGGYGNLLLSGLAPSTVFGISYRKDGVSIPMTSFTSSAAGIVTIPSLTAGSYSQLSVDYLGCSRTEPQTFTLSNPSLPTFSVTTTEIETCGGVGTIALNGLSASSLYSITYSKDGITVPAVTLTSSTTGEILLTNRSAGSYSQLTVSTNGCSAIEPQIITLSQPSSPNFSVTQADINTCGGVGFISLSGLTAGTVYTISYTKDNMPLPATDFVANQNGVITMNNLSSGNYTALSLARLGCTTIHPEAIVLLDNSASTGEIWYADSDGDTYGNPSLSQRSCSQPVGFVINATDCNDTDASINPSTTWYADSDNDTFGNSTDVLTGCEAPAGYVKNATDCNDSDATIHPGTIWYVDEDADTYGNPIQFIVSCTAPTGYVRNNMDCNDSDNSLHPSTLWYADADGDNYGNPLSTTTGCNPPAGYVRDNSDCNDTDAYLLPTTLWYADRDNDTYGDPTQSRISCTAPIGYVRDKTDCDDTDARITPLTVWFADSDGDGFGTTQSTLVACAKPNGYVLDNSDCDDLVPGKTPPVLPVLLTTFNTVCTETNTTIEVLSSDSDITWIWTGTPGIIQSTASSSAMVKSSTSGTHTIEVQARTGCGLSPILPIPITFSTELATPLRIDGPTEVCPNSRMMYSTPTLPGILSYSWTVPSGITILQGQHTNSIQVETGSTVILPNTIFLQVTNSCGTSQPVSINLIDGKCAQETVFIPNVFTPGSSDDNGVWTIDGIQDYPNAVVRIVNRWGAGVFESIGYEKPWDGTFNGKTLPTGTYYYSIDLGNGTKLKTGSITIVY
jgi:gliding motility-associated-like protein